MRSRCFLLILATAAALASGVPVSLAAPPDVPAQLSYQGVLLDDLGNPQTGPVDLVVRIYDQSTGGTLLYKEVFDATPLSAGTFTVVIGSTGEATDTPDDPLTTSLADVFTGDLVAGPGRFVEVGVGGDPPLARIQVLASPLALRAGSAAQADTATTVTTVNGVDASVVSEIFEHFNFDGGPPNDDPSEGIGDTDGDGIANFVDPDNDDDGLDDSTEVAQGSDINLVTPDVTGVNPDQADFGFPTDVTVIGTSFEPGISVVFGAETPLPTSVTPDSFVVTVGPQPAGPVDVQVTRTNGETTVEPNVFSFEIFMPTITGVAPDTGPTNSATAVTVTGTNFDPGMTVDFGSQSPTPTSVTPTSFDVVVGPQPEGAVDVQVMRANGASATLADGFVFEVPGASPHGGSLLRFATFDVSRNGLADDVLMGQQNDNYFLDTHTLTSPAIFDNHVEIFGQGRADFTFASDGELWGLQCGPFGLPCDVRFLNDPDDDGIVTPASVVENIGVSLISASLALTAADEPVAAYTRGGTLPRQVVVAHDRDGDATYGGTNEIVEVESTVEDADVDVAVNSAGHVALLYLATDAGADSLRMAHDRNDDGDYDDTIGSVPEKQTLLPGSVDCFGVAYDASDRVAVVYVAAGTGTATLLRDLDADGDFDGASEEQALPGIGVDACAITGGASGLAVVTNADGTTRLFDDENDDGSFTGAESQDLGTPSDELALARNELGQLFVVNEVNLLSPF